MSTNILLVVVLFICACAQEPPADYWPTHGWRTSTPEAQGMDRAVLEALHREFEEDKHGYVDGMLVVRHGHVIFEKSYRRDYDPLFAGKGAPGIYNYYDPDWHPYYFTGWNIYETPALDPDLALDRVLRAVRDGRSSPET